MEDRILRSIEKVQTWVERHDYKGHEPSDGNLSFLHVLTFGNGFLERALQQVVWKSPFDIRRLVGVHPHRSTKGTGYMAWGYTLMHERMGGGRYREHAEACFDWLLANRAPGQSEHCWGDHFPYSSRGGQRPALAPITVWTSLIGQAFVHAYDVFKVDRYLEIAHSAASWVAALPFESSRQGICLSYSALRQSSIHNSNMLGAALLATVGRRTGNAAWQDRANQAIEYTCSRQLPDGSWYYGEDPKWHWIDSFHTGYNLDSLRQYMDSTGDRTYEANLQRGYAFFKTKFFETDGRPKYYHNMTYPIDIQCCSQAIETLVMFAGYDGGALGLAETVAGWTIANMQDRDGHFYYRDLGWRKVKTPMFHWGQATMFKALAQLCLGLQNVPKRKGHSSE